MECQENSCKKTVSWVTKQITEQAWLLESKSKAKRSHLWLALVLLLVVYFLKWGLGAERAISCLIYEKPPKGRWFDQVAPSLSMTLVVIVVSFFVLLSLQGGSLFRRFYSHLEPCVTLAVGATWTGVLGAAWCLQKVLPDSSCERPLESSTLGNSLESSLSGASEEVWFAAVIAVWMLLYAERPYIKWSGILIGGAVLRGIFHTYYGWGSIGLFFWGAVVALVIACTGKWIILFVLHFLYNFVVSYREVDSLVGVATCVLLLLLVAAVACVRSVLTAHQRRRNSSVTRRSR